MGKEFDIDKFRNILIPRFDTFGDIVLLQGFIQALLDLLPEALITLLVREGYDQLAEVFPERLIWKTIAVDPYREGPSAAAAEALFQELDAESYDLLLTTTYTHTWPDDLVAAKLGSVRSIALGEPRDISSGALQILQDMNVETPPCPYDEFVPVKEKSHETEKYQVLWQRLTGQKDPLALPQISVPNRVQKKAQNVLSTLGLREGEFLFCFPAGVANVSRKNWPEASFAKVIASLEKKHKMKALVAGHESERKIVENVIGLAKQQGAHPKQWLGKNGDIPLACSLVQQSSLYLGNDTGLMHMAAALNKPVLAMFGGGHWPRFLPHADVGRVFIQELPCFYCKWDCLFGEPLCIRSLSASAIIGEIEGVVEKILSGKGDFKVTRIKVNMTQLSVSFEKALDGIQSLQNQLELSEADRAARLDQIKEFSNLLKESEADRSARLEAINTYDKLLAESEADRKAKLDRIRELSNLLRESEADRAARLEAINSYEKLLHEARQVQKDLETKLHESELIREEILYRLPLVSIVTPVFNAERWLEICIESVASQDYPRIEHIIVDGGSTDSTLEICSRYRHLIVHSSPDRGQSHAINKGFSMARGEILAWLCADDEYESNAVSTAVKALQRGEQIAMGSSRFINEEGEVIFDHQANQYPYYDHKMLLQFWEYGTISQPATFWRRDLWEACGPLRENLFFAMDYDLWLRMSQRTKFMRIPTYFARYRIHPDAKCFSDNYGSKIELIRVSRNYWPSKWKPEHWKLYFKYILSTNAITQHYSDGEQLLKNAIFHLDKNESLRAIGSFVMAHIKHLATPLLPEYKSVFQRVLVEGIGPVWFWRFAKKIVSILLVKKELFLVIAATKDDKEASISLKAESTGYKDPEFRFWTKRGDDFILLRDWASDDTCVANHTADDSSEFGVHIRVGDSGDFIAQAWAKRALD